MQQQINCSTQVSAIHDITGLVNDWWHIICNTQVSATHDSTGWGLVNVNHIIGKLWLG